MDRRHIALLFVVGVLALALAVVARRNVNESPSQVAASPVINGDSNGSQFDGALLPPGVRAPNFSLRDQNGRRVRMSDYRGRNLIVTFLYSHCKTECPVQAQQIKGALNDVGHEIPALAVSVDPPGDSPASVKRFNREQGVTGRLRWVLGDVGQLRRLWKAF